MAFSIPQTSFWSVMSLFITQIKWLSFTPVAPEIWQKKSKSKLADSVKKASGLELFWEKIIQKPGQIVNRHSQRH